MYSWMVYTFKSLSDVSLPWVVELVPDWKKPDQQETPKETEDEGLYLLIKYITLGTLIGEIKFIFMPHQLFHMFQLTTV